MHIIVGVFITALSVFVIQYLIPGVSVDGFISAVMVAIVLGIVNIIVKPILALITLPINLLTFGLFTFVINAIMILLVDYLVGSFHVEGFFTALLFSLVLSVVSSILKFVFRIDD